MQKTNYLRCSKLNIRVTLNWPETHCRLSVPRSLHFTPRTFRPPAHSVVEYYNIYDGQKRYIQYRPLLPPQPRSLGRVIRSSAKDDIPLWVYLTPSPKYQSNSSKVTPTSSNDPNFTTAYDSNIRPLPSSR